MRAMTLLALVASTGFAQGLESPHIYRSGGLSHAFPSTVSGTLLSFLPNGSASLATASECAGTTPTGTKGETLTFTRSSSAVCTKTDGTLVTLTSNQPRVNASGLLVEAPATNLALRSQEFDNASWTKEVSASTANTTTSPDGTADAETLTASAGVGQHRFYQSYAGGSAQYTHSLYAKAGTVGWIRLYSGTGSVMQAAFNLSTGVVGLTAGGATSTITASANGFYRVTMTFTDTPTFFIVNFGSSEANTSSGGYAAAGTETVVIYGAQSETGAFASSYISTAGTTVTRSADLGSLATPAALSDTTGCIGATFYTGAAGGVVVDFIGSTPLYLQSATNLRGDDGVNTASLTTPNILSRAVFASMGWAASTLTLTSEGSSATATYDGTIVGSTIYLGDQNGGSSFLNGYVRGVIVGASPGACR